MKQRIITGVVAGLAFIIVIAIGGLPFALLSLLLATVAMVEVLKMKGVSVLSLVGGASLLLVWAVFVPTDIIDTFSIAVLDKNVLIFTFVFLLLILTVVTKNRFSIDDAGFVFIMSVYIGIGFSSFMETRFLDQGLALVFFILFIIWATDSGAYFIGKRFGKRKLAPHISPKKTIEGFFGGIAVALVVGMVYTLMISLFESVTYTLLLITVASIVGQLGDLIESALKRHQNVKDSGSILPGHGGILDRFDSLLFVMPIVYLFFMI
ncbi:phosphatidate cytidylyltransferase [Texcoconibacillus texcoconensis]|uniref:Phosphatidate cytidylyltransferase n=1 Tax=Texcoconibacillus texcoconensis TaxID=1095777 RepID=A0A840QKS4_9BACI|nr:phosphatidate cytidylyltransferase [Texcoconibacillus texcoconensis]MBB5172043.1 phosphatidate cytidylyltransferase [Texcoconibacillus texcoconensis]